MDSDPQTCPVCIWLDALSFDQGVESEIVGAKTSIDVMTMNLDEEYQIYCFPAFISERLGGAIK